LKQAAALRQDVSETGLRRALVVAVMAATLMQTLDSTIKNVALPSIQGNLGAIQDEGVDRSRLTRSRRSSSFGFAERFHFLRV
jgi:hypothetical protein